MQIPQIRLHQTYAQIGLRISQPVQEIEQPPAALSIKQEPAKLNIERIPSHLDIDQEQAWNELNLKSLSVFCSDNAEEAKQIGLDAIGEIAEEGDQLAKIEDKTDAFNAIVTEKTNPAPADFNIAFIPSYGSVRIHYTPDDLHLNWELGGAKIDSVQHRPIHNYTPGKTEVYLKQMQHLQIDFVGTNVNGQI